MPIEYQIILHHQIMLDALSLGWQRSLDGIFGILFASFITAIYASAIEASMKIGLIVAFVFFIAMLFILTILLSCFEYKEMINQITI